MGRWQDLLNRLGTGSHEAPQAIQTARLTIGAGDALSWEPGFVRRRWHVGPWAHNPDGTVFGGLIAALVDQMTGAA